MKHLHSFEDFISESHVQVKRKYTEFYPKISVYERTSIRSHVLMWMNEMGTVTKKELTKFIKGVNEKYGRLNNSRWLDKNKRLFKVKIEESTGETYYKLSPLAKRIIERTNIKINENTEKVSESAEINRYNKDYFAITSQMKATVDKWKNATGAEKDELLQLLKDLTARKKDVEQKLNAAIANKDRDIELVISDE